MTCTPADDAYLIAAWPGVVLRTGERWLVVVAGAPDLQTGGYSVSMQGLPFEYAATVPPDTSTVVRDGLLSPLGAQLMAAASPQGLSGILLQEVVQPGVVPGGLAVEVAGPAAATISATLISGGDGNATQRAAWLERTLCWLPPCYLFACCPGDYTLMHAAIAAHMLFTTAPANVGSTGGGANDFERMRLGPAELSRGQQGWSGGTSPTDDALAKTAPGQLYLMLRARYVFPIMCA